jgi:hypothetical protein
VYCITGLRYKQRDKVFSPEEKTQSVDFEFANPRSYDGRHGEATLEAGKDRGRFQDWAPIPDCNRILTSWTVQNHGQRIAERQIGVYLDLPKPFEVIKASWKHATEQEGYNPDTSLPGYLYLQSILPCRPETKFAY